MALYMLCHIHKKPLNRRSRSWFSPICRIPSQHAKSSAFSAYIPASGKMLQVSPCFWNQRPSNISPSCVYSPQIPINKIISRMGSVLEHVPCPSRGIALGNEGLEIWHLQWWWDNRLHLGMRRAQICAYIMKWHTFVLNNIYYACLCY